ncbi:MAG TPA: hypothetical protein VFZ41_08450 [Solirubrobacterales bacterium]
MPGRGPSYTEEEARAAIAASKSWAEALRGLGLCPSGGGWRILKKYARLWQIPTDHFQSESVRQENLSRKMKRPLAEVLVEGSTFSRHHLKRRLFAEGLKAPLCELCGQSEIWRGKPMSMILDHINGVRDDHRLENLRIVCPNCAATLDTHCGRKNRITRVKRDCLRCGKSFVPGYATQKYCSRGCGVRWDRSSLGRARLGLRGVPNPESRKVERPPYEQLLEELKETSYLAVGRKYGVSDNAVRKWVRFYQRQIEREQTEARDSEAGDDDRAAA